MNPELVARGLDARRAGDSWMAKCPAHDDENPSLSIRAINGTTLVHCHAGCEQQDVIKALIKRGLWRFDCAESSRVVATYNYTDEHGKLLYQVVRYEPKSFKQRRPDELGGWIWKKGERQVLYRLPEVVYSPIVFVVEGEKDAETLRGHGFVATTNAGGASARWLPQYTESLYGREVIIIPDADGPGCERAKRIGRMLLGHVAHLMVWQPDRAKDITDWFQQGHSELELIECTRSAEVRL